MKLPKELQGSLGCSKRDVEEIVRYCAKVCDEIGPQHNDPFQSQRCKQAILAAFDLEEKK